MRIVRVVFSDEPEMEQCVVVDELANEALLFHAERLVSVDEATLLKFLEHFGKLAGFLQLASCN